MLSITSSIRPLRYLHVQVSLFVLIMVCLLLPETVRGQVVSSSAQRTIGSGLGLPLGVAVDASGNVYIADFNPGSLLKETLSAGNYTQSQISVPVTDGNVQPLAIAVDASGDIYFTEDYQPYGEQSGQAYKLTLSDGSYSLSTIASGLGYVGGIAVDGSGNVYIGHIVETNDDPGIGQVLKETPSAGSYIQSVVANLTSNGRSDSGGVAVDRNGNVYIADSFNNQVLKETLSAGSYTQSIIASSLGSPAGVAVDGNGNVFIADTGNSRVLKETLTGTSYTESLVPSTALVSPSGVAVDASGKVYIADSGGNAVYIDNDPQVAAALGGNFGNVNVGSTSASPVTVIFTFATGGTLGSKTVLTQGATGLDFTDAGTGTCASGTAYSAGDSCTIDVNFSPRFPWTQYGAAELLDSSGIVLATGYLQGTGVGPQISFVPGTASSIPGSVGPIAVDASGDLYTLVEYNQLVKETPLKGGGYTQSTVATNDSANGYSWGDAIAVDGSGSVYFSEMRGSFGFGPYSVVRATLSNGAYIQSNVASGLASISGIAVDGSGNVYIANSGYYHTGPQTSIGEVFKETPSAGAYLQSTVVSGSAAIDFLAVDGSGNVYFTSTSSSGYPTQTNSSILEETPSAGGYIQSTVATFSEYEIVPEGLAVDGGGDVYTLYNSQLLKETPSAGGYIQTTFPVDLWPQYEFVAVDGSGNLYFVGEYFVGENPYTNYSEMVEENLANPPSIRFDNPDLDSTTTQTVTVQNSGNAPLMFPVPNSGDNPDINGPFTLGSSGESACPLVTSSSSPGTLAAGASCLLPITFAPTATGTLSGSLALTDNTLNAAAPGYAVQTISLSGTEGSPAPATLISPASGSAFTGSNVTFTWTAGTGVTGYQFTFGYGNPNLMYPTYSLTSTTATSANVTGIQTYGQPVWVILGSQIGGQWQYNTYNFTEEINGPAVLTSPTAGSTLTGSTQTFTWSAGVGVSGYSLQVWTNGAGSGLNYLYGLYAPPITATSVTLTNIPTNGVTVYARLGSTINGDVWYLNYSFTAPGGPPAPAALSSPTQGTTLPGSSETFTWTPGVGVAGNELWLGTTGVGSNNLFHSTWSTATSVTVNNIPTYGGTVFVRLCSSINGVAQYIDYTFIESGGPPVAATIASPTPGTPLPGSIETFTWTTGSGVTRYVLRVGTTGSGSSNIYNSGSITATSATVYAIPANGGTLYVRLSSEINGTWQFNDYTFIEFGLPEPAALTAPTGTTLAGSSVPFWWSTGSQVVSYELKVGTAGTGSNNIYDSGSTTATSAMVSNIPTIGATVYVQLISNFSGAPSQTANYTFTEATSAAAALTAPTGTTLTGSSVAFEWTAGNLVSAYELWVGTTGVTSSNLYNSGRLNNTSATVNNIPTSGGRVFVRLMSLINGTWQFTDYTFTESGGPPAAATLISPTGTTLTGSSQTFTWSPGAGVSRYALRVGTTGYSSKDIFDTGSTMATSATVNNIPTNGGTVFVGVSSEINGVWQYVAYTFLEAGGPPVPAALTSPTGSTLSGASQTFTWTLGAGVTGYEFWVGTAGVSSSNLYDSGWTTATNAMVSNIPTSGGMVFVRLWSLVNGTWQFTDYSFVASGTAVAATLISPTGTTLAGGSQTFTWTSGTGVTRYALRVGTTGYGSKDIYDTGSTTATSATVNIPSGGGTIYVGVSSQIDGVWKYVAYTFTAP